MSILLRPNPLSCLAIDASSSKGGGGAYRGDPTRGPTPYPFTYHFGSEGTPIKKVSGAHHDGLLEGIPFTYLLILRILTKKGIQAIQDGEVNNREDFVTR